MIVKKNKLAIGISAIIVIIITVKILGGINWMTMSTNTMEPNIHINSTVFISNIPNIEQNDIIAFKTEIDPNPLLFRVVGRENDTIEIRNGTLYRNSTKDNDDYNIAQQFKVSRNRFLNIKDSKEIFHSYNQVQLSYMDTFFVSTDNKSAKNLNLKKHILKKTDKDIDIEQLYQRNWNIDNFGPVVIPKNKFFVLGDNRPDSYDSRFIGFIDKKNIIGKVLFHL